VTFGNQRLDSHGGDVLCVHKCLAYVAEWRRQHARQDARLEEALVEVPVESVGADDRPCRAGAADQALGGEQAVVSQLLDAHAGQQDQALDASRDRLVDEGLPDRYAVWCHQVDRRDTR
jgi:hypothetical protein